MLPGAIYGSRKAERSPRESEGGMAARDRGWDTRIAPPPRQSTSQSIENPGSIERVKLRAPATHAGIISYDVPGVCSRNVARRSINSSTTSIPTVETKYVSSINEYFCDTIPGIGTPVCIIYFHIIQHCRIYWMYRNDDDIYWKYHVGLAGCRLLA